MIKNRLIKKEATNSDVGMKFNSLNNKKKLLDKIKIPIISF